MKRVLLGAFSILISLNLFAQTKGQSGMPAERNCATQIPDQAWENWMQQKIVEFKQQQQANKGMLVNYTIPVIVHVLHKNDAANITAAQVNSQITVLNADYGGTNSDYNNTPTVFQSARAGNSGITFCLAKVDPNGNTLAEPGIDRINWSTKGWTDPNSFTSSSTLQSYYNGTIKPASIWDPTKYLNIWVSYMDGSGLLGYASFPAGTGLTGLSGVETATTCGVVINVKAFGNTGIVAAPYNKGRTATHEVGHWLGLRHIWGDGTCATDYCNDTPPAQTSNYSCPTHPYNSGKCTGNTTGEMFMNYMDYTDDACMYMFTADQATRMQTAMANGTYRAPLTNSGKCNSPTALDASVSAILSPVNGSSTCINSITPVVTLMNVGNITLTSCQIQYNMDGAANQTYTWTGSLTSGSTVNVTLPAYTGLSSASHTFTAKTNLPNGSTDQATSNDQKTSTFTVTSAPSGSALPFTQDYQGTTFVPTGWSYTPPNTANQWSRVTTAGGFGTSTASAKMDNYSGNTDITGQLDAMISPAVSLANANSTLKLKFDYAYARYNNSSADSLLIYISTDCKATWTKLWAKGGSGMATAANTTTAFTPTATQWKKDSVSLSSYSGISAVYFKFESKSGWGNNLYLDNINVNYTPTAQAPVANFTLSNSTICAGQSVTFTDNSTNTPTSWSWTVNGGTPTTATTQNVTSTFANAGTYNITLIASNSAGSNTTTKTLTVVANPTISVTPASPSVCSGSSTTLTASGASTYSWNTGASSAAITVSPTANTNYTVTGTANGCSSASITSVSVKSNPTVTATAATPTICSGNSATIIANGATSYSWNTGATGSSLAVSPSTTTTYTVTGTTNGCSASATQTINVNTTPTVNISSTATTLCSGNSTTLTASGATTYSWSNGSTSNSITVSPTTTTAYTVVGTTLGCSGSKNQTITVNTTPTVVLTASKTTICNGESITLSAAGANLYSWSNGQTTASIIVNPTSNTTYTVTGSSTTGCSDVKMVSITVNQLPTVAISANNSSICAGSSSTLTGTGANTYSWSSGQSTSSITVSPSITTTYTLTGTSNGCSSNATQQITVNSLPNVQASAVNSTICSGNSTTLNASGSSSYSWSNGSIGSSVSVNPLTSTVYTVTGSNGTCSNTSQVSVTVNQSPSPVITASTNGVCPGESAVLTASGASTYSWSTGSSSNSITVSPSAATIYTLVGTSNGCSVMVTKTITVGAQPVVNVSASLNTICAGSNTTLTASGATNYSWSNGASGNSIVVNPTQNTSYNVWGNNGGCADSASVSINVTGAPSVTLQASSSEICAGQTVNMTAGGALTYSWSDGQTGSNVNANPVTTTTYTVYGSDGICTSKADVTITVNQYPLLSVTSSASTICSGSSVQVYASGASNYLWSNGNTSSSFVVSPNTDTTFSVIGSNGLCNDTGSVSINVTANPNVSITASATSICSGDVVTLTGNGAGNFSWSTGETTSSINVSPTQTSNYVLYGYNSGCSGMANVSITVNAGSSVAVSTASTNVCIGSSTTLSATGATTYSWSTGQTGSSITVSPTTQSTYTVFGFNGNCSSEDVITITTSLAPNASISATSTTVCSGTSTTLTANGANSYSWNTGSTSATLIVSPTVSTTYSVIGDMGGCKDTAIQTINVTGAPVVSINVANTTICSGDTAHLLASGGATYSWSTGALTSNIDVAPVATTTYFVTGYLNGCSASASKKITVNAGPNLGITASATTVCRGDQVTLSGSGAQQYSWNTGDPTKNITTTVDSTTTYVLIGTKNGCTETLSQVVSVDQGPAISVSASATEICQGTNTTLTASGVSTYSWASGQTTTSITVSPNVLTTYTVYGNNGGCEGLGTVTISVNAAPQISINASTDSICQGETSTLIANGASSYVWSNGSQSNAITISPAQHTTYTVTGSNGVCEGTATQTILSYPAPYVTGTATKFNVCVGEKVVLTGTGAYSYVWDNNVTNGVPFEPTESATYMVIGTDIHGCIDLDSVRVNLMQNPIVTLSASADTVCNNGGSIQLTGLPAGGIFSGNGVSGNSFDPAFALSGQNAVFYSYTDGYGCSNEDTTSILVEICTGIQLNNIEHNYVSVTPNPASGFVTIKQTGFDNTELNFYNTNGQIVKSIELNQLEISISVVDLPAGIYLLKTTNNIYTGKVSVIR